MLIGIDALEKGYEVNFEAEYDEQMAKFKYIEETTAMFSGFCASLLQFLTMSGDIYGCLRA